MTIRRLQRPEPSEYHPRFSYGIDLVPEAASFTDLLREQIEATGKLVAEFGEENAAVRYAPEKWTVRESIGHLSDAERIFAFRALSIARGEQATLPAFDENEYVPAGRFERRSLASVMSEFRAVRAGTIALVDGLDDSALTTMGRIAAGPISVRAVLYFIAGHERHHLALLRERYLPHARMTSAR